MAVYAANIKQPSGYIPSSWFDDVALSIWIGEGVAKTTAITDTTRRDEAVKAWAYYRAYDLKAQEKEDQPQSSSLSGAASITYGDKRSEMWRLKATEWLNRFNDVLAGTETSIPSFLFTTASGRRGR